MGKSVPRTPLRSAIHGPFPVSIDAAGARILNPGPPAPVVVFTARQIMHTEVLTLDPSVDCLTASRKMVEAHHGYVVLARGEGQPVGIVTEWDYVEKIVARGIDPSSKRLEEIATPDVITCDLETPTDRMVEIMATRGIRRMLVTENGKIVGVVTSKDVIRIFREYVNRLSADIARLQIPPMW